MIVKLVQENPFAEIIVKVPLAELYSLWNVGWVQHLSPLDSPPNEGVASRPKHTLDSCQ
jgi:hypothetical protein